MSDEKYVIFPEVYKRRELNAQYRAIPLKDTTSRLLRKYFNAMANLYGIIPLRKAKEIIFSLSPRLVTEDAFFAFAEIARHECEGYYIMRVDELYEKVSPTESLDPEIIDIDLLTNPSDDEDLFAETRASQWDKPYYVPDKSHLLAYADPYYCEDRPEKAALLSFMQKRFGLNDNKAETVLMFLSRNSRSIAGKLEDALSYFEEVGIDFQSDQDFDLFLDLYKDFRNTTRMACNRGYTPSEMMQLIPPEERFKSLSLGPNIRKSLQNGEWNLEEFRKRVLTTEMPSESMRMDVLRQLAEIKASMPQPEEQKKVGRNDPCPCGSGKKYKHCCGK